MISIIIPVHERIEFLAECIESCLNQTYPDYEIIIVKSGSHTEVEKTLNAYKTKLRIIEINENNHAIKLNKGIENSKGEWIKTCSSDDMLTPNCLEVFSKNRDKNKFYYSYFHYINQYNVITNTYDNISIVAGYFHKSLWEKLGKFNPSVVYEDKDFIDKVPKSDFVKLDEITALYRNHIGQTTKTLQQR